MVYQWSSSGLSIVYKWSGSGLALIWQWSALVYQWSGSIDMAMGWQWLVSTFTGNLLSLTTTKQCSSHSSQHHKPSLCCAWINPDKCQTSVIDELSRLIAIPFLSLEHMYSVHGYM